MLFGKKARRIRRLLIVEDEPLIAFDNESVLQDAGYEVVATVNTGEAAVELLAGGEAVDALILDRNLAGAMDGVAVAKVAHQRGIAVLFVTSDCPQEARAFSVGCLAKPYTQRELAGAIDVVDAIVAGEEVKAIPGRLELFDSAAA